MSKIRSFNEKSVIKIAPFLPYPNKYTAFGEMYLRPNGKSTNEERKLLKSNGFYWDGGTWRLNKELVNS